MAAPRPSLTSRSIPTSRAIAIVTLTTFFAFLLAPLAVAQVQDLPQVPGAGEEQPETTAPDLGVAPPDLDSGGIFDVGSMEFTIAVSVIGLIGVGIATALGTKYVNSENVLENEARRTIFEFIKTHPGAHLRATAAALSLSTTNVLWHLRKLEGANLVASKKYEGYKVFYPVEGGVASRQRALAMAVLRNDHAKVILDYILGQPSAHQREIARAMGVNHGTIRWHLRKLTDCGVILMVKKDTHTSYYVSELGLQLMNELGNAKAQAHVSGAMKAPGAVVPASIALPVATAQPAVPAHVPAPAYAPEMDE